MSKYPDFDLNFFCSYDRMGYEPALKRRRPDYGPPPLGYERPLGPPGPAQPHSMADLDMLQQENMLLKSRVEELKKQVQELTTTNNFLLEQNASLRLSVKGPQPQPIPMAQAAPQPAVSMQPPISIEMPMATTSISMAPQTRYVASKNIVLHETTTSRI